MVFVYDTRTPTIEPGPGPGPYTNLGKKNHRLFSFESNLFALSTVIYGSGDEMGNSNHPRPSFEVWDTNNTEGEWINLPMPTLQTTTNLNVYSISAICAVFVEGYSGCYVFISVDYAGSYVFDVNNMQWSHIGDDMLPFSDQAQTIPDDPFVCCAYSSGELCSFRFSKEIGGFKVEEIKIDGSENLFPLEPQLSRNRPLRTVLGSSGRVYLIASGVDNGGSYDSVGNRYIKVSALGPKLDLATGQVLKRCSNKKKRRKTRDGTEEDDMTVRWRLCYSGGSVCDYLIHVAGAFAM